jgi:hypothetical protein
VHTLDFTLSARGRIHAWDLRHNAFTRPLGRYLLHCTCTGVKTTAPSNASAAGGCGVEDGSDGTPVAPLGVEVMCLLVVLEATSDLVVEEYEVKCTILQSEGCSNLLVDKVVFERVDVAVAVDRVVIDTMNSMLVEASNTLSQGAEDVPGLHRSSLRPSELASGEFGCIDSGNFVFDCIE